ncbi:MAG: hypothetical protein U1E70_23900 [Acetobacteraceae bacterium]
MPDLRCVNSAPLLAACFGLTLLWPAGMAAMAQSQPAPPAAAAHGSAAPDTATEQEEPVPVLTITGVEVVRTKVKPGFDLVVVSGLVASEGWTHGELVPLTRGSPSDQVLNLVLVAQPPAESSAPTGYVPIHALMPLPADHPYKAVRVRSATNSVLLKSLPGVVEVTVPADPCKPCIGRQYVAKGEAVPAGVPQDQVLRQEDLPPNARVIRPNDGISDLGRNPGRLTLVIGEDGRVVDAAWE